MFCFSFGFSRRCLKRPNKKHPTRPVMTGFFFCLASTRCRAFILPGGVSATHKRSQQIFCYQCNYTAKTSKAFTGLYRGISVNLTHSSAHNTAATQAAYAPLAPRWRAYRQAQHLQKYPDTAATPDAVQGRATAYYNKVYKGASLLWIHARLYSIAQTMPAAAD